jgi:hypothetical protein
MKKWTILLIVFLAALFLISPVVSYWNTLPQASYRLANQIKDFPINGLSLIIWSYSIINTSLPNLSLTTLPFDWQYVVFNVSIINLENQEVNFTQRDVEKQLSQATSKNLYLDLVASHGGGSSSPRIPDGYSDWWGVALSKPLTHMKANERVDGFMVFTKDPGLVPKQLVCKSIFETKPLFVVQLD